MCVILGHMASPTVRRRRLGAELRRLRTEAGMTQDEVAERLDQTANWLSRIEGAKAAKTRTMDVEALLNLYGVSDPDVRKELIQWAKDARTKGWWAGFRGVLEDKFAGLEDAAEVIRHFNPAIVPGLLQTEDYARTVFAGAHPRATEAELDQRLTARMKRREILDRAHAPALWAVVGEAVLYQLIGGPTVLADQLTELDNAGQQPGITIQVLPYRAGSHAGVDGAFAVFSFPEIDDMDVGVVEGMMGTIYLEDADDVARCVAAHDHIRAVALSPADSLQMIRTAREGLI